MFYELEHISSNYYFKKLYCENFTFPTHLHNCFEFVVSLSGVARVTVEGREYGIEEGEALLIFPHQLHSFSYSEGRHMICIFSPKLVSAYYDAKLKHRPKQNKFTPSQQLISAIDCYTCDSQRLFEKGILYLLCNEFDKDAKYEESINKSLLEKIFLFVNLNFSSSCSLSSIAENIGYNASYVSRYFKKCVGISLSDYINMVRLSNACYKYENSDDTILSCALSCGFDSLRTFNRNFQKFYKLSPREYFRQKSK